MKVFLLIITIGLVLTLKAQDNSEILDKSNLHSSKYGMVAQLKQDNMPCVLPYKNTTKAIPNSNNKVPDNNIPNLWQQPNKRKLYDSATIKNVQEIKPHIYRIHK